MSGLLGGIAAQFPSVPDLPGVPALLRAAGASLPLPVIAVADALGLGEWLGQPQWGVFDSDGQPVIIGDAVVGVGFSQDYQLASFPQEAGAFASYNKVTIPARAKVTFTAGGNNAARNAFLAQVKAACASLSLFQVNTPEFVHASVNPVHFDYQRTNRAGAQLITVDVWLEEVRVTGTAQFSSSKSPNGAAQRDGGAVQAGDLSGTGASLPTSTVPATVPVIATPLPPAQ